MLDVELLKSRPAALESAANEDMAGFRVDMCGKERRRRCDQTAVFSLESQRELNSKR